MEKEINIMKERDADSIRTGITEHIKYTLGKDITSPGKHDNFTALALTVRDRIMDRWIETNQVHARRQVKRLYYLSLEFLMGRALGNNIINLNMEKEVREALEDTDLVLDDLEELEADAGLGNGGLGRLAACFMDSLATMEYPAFGYGIRYNYGIFKQTIENGYQRENPDDWLSNGNPWEIKRPEVTVSVAFGGKVVKTSDGSKSKYKWIPESRITGTAYDTPIVGYKGKTVNTLRLWSAEAPRDFDFEDFNNGNYVDAVSEKLNAENITKVLYPNDKLYLGKELRLKQQYFFVACSLNDITGRFKSLNKEWHEFPDYAAIQMNDTHPSIAIPELMRILIDEENLDWDYAWEIAVKVFGYTNHTLMPEALEKWTLPLIQNLLPRHVQIIFEINEKFLTSIRSMTKHLGLKIMDIIPDVSIVEESNPKQIRMANLAIIGSHSVNGVAALHSELIKQKLVPGFAKLFPERFNNKTNGITQRRWLLSANPPLAQLITKTIGDSWITSFHHLQKLKPYAQDPVFRKKFEKTKQKGKLRLAETLFKESGIKINPNSIMDVQIKRIHEYKRQLLNALHIIILYNRIRKNNNGYFSPITFILGGKAAPGYEKAKIIIKFLNNIASVINNDSTVNKVLNVFFIPNYRVSLAERIIPAADISEQISTAGTEASGTGNMKFMCNGAITLGTMDGANIEIVEEAGLENEIIFGLKADEVEALKPRYNPREYYESDEEIKEAIDLVNSEYFNKKEPGIFKPIESMLFEEGDKYMHLADLGSYRDAHAKAVNLYLNRDEWNKKIILNIAAAGKFSSDRTIGEYAEEIWKLEKCPIL